MTGQNSNDGARADLAALDPDVDGGAEEQFVGAVRARMEGTGVAPTVPLDPLYGLWSLPRPLLIAASLLTLAVLGASMRVQRERDATPATIADATGIPPLFLASGARRP